MQSHFLDTVIPAQPWLAAAAAYRAMESVRALHSDLCGLARALEVRGEGHERITMNSNEQFSQISEFSAIF